jgi:hypothetical protein
MVSRTGLLPPRTFRACSELSSSNVVRFNCSRRLGLLEFSIDSSALTCAAVVNSPAQQPATDSTADPRGLRVPCTWRSRGGARASHSRIALLHSAGRGAVRGAGIARRRRRRARIADGSLRRVARLDLLDGAGRGVECRIVPALDHPGSIRVQFTKRRSPHLETSRRPARVIHRIPPLDWPSVSNRGN